MADKTMSSSSELADIESLRQERDELRAKLDDQEAFMSKYIRGATTVIVMIVILWLIDSLPRSPMARG